MSILSANRPEVIVHAGALSKPDECELNQELTFRTNVTATGHLLKVAAQLRSFFLFLSTDFIFSGKEGIYSEEDPAEPVNYYGQTKLKAEELIKKYSFDWSIVRTVLVYGPPLRIRQNILTMVANKLRDRQTLKVFDDQVRTPTYVEVLTQGIKTIIDKRTTSIFHLFGEDVGTPYEMAVEVADYLGLDSHLKGDRRVFSTTCTLSPENKL